MRVKRPSPHRHVFTTLGAVLALGVFFAVALDSALIYGGAAGSAIAHGLGLPTENGGKLARLVMWYGMVLGALATAAISLVVGAVLGAAAFGLTGKRSTIIEFDNGEGAS